MDVLDRSAAEVGFTLSVYDDVIFALYPLAKAQQEVDLSQMERAGMENSRQRLQKRGNTICGEFRLAEHRAIESVDRDDIDRLQSHDRHFVPIFQRFKDPRGDRVPAAGWLQTRLHQENVFHFTSGIQCRARRLS